MAEEDRRGMVERFGLVCEGWLYLYNVVVGAERERERLVMTAYTQWGRHRAGISGSGHRCGSPFIIESQQLPLL